uniref:Uncharacterized protein n=1 Tax=Ditylenchus dipsaci TaxID=166011 RepID=A0A915ESI0_9BILA
MGLGLLLSRNINQSSSSVSIEVVSQPWNPPFDISQPQVEAASEESKLLSIQWKKSAEGSIQNAIASPNLYCNCESPSGSRSNKVNPFDRSSVCVPNVLHFTPSPYHQFTNVPG